MAKAGLSGGAVTEEGGSMKTLVIGSAMFEMLMKLDALPKTGEDVLCRESDMIIGGCAYNVAGTLRNMGCPHDLCVPVGKGPYAAVIAQHLKRCGYEILIRDESQDNGWCLDLVEADGERTFITSQGIEATFRKEWFDGIAIAAYDKIYVSGYQLCGDSGREMAQWLESLRGKQLFFAPGPVIGQIPEAVKAAIYRCHPILHLNEKEAGEESGENRVKEAAESLYDRTGNLVIITLGAKGALFYDGNALHSIPSEPTVVADTIGAGDSHMGAVIASLSGGYDTETAIRIANRVAAAIVGIQGPVMDREQFEERLGEWNEKDQRVF